jgi:hypothetical protein
MAIEQETTRNTALLMELWEPLVPFSPNVLPF